MAAPEPPVHKDRVHFLLRPTACPSPRAPTPQGTGDLLFGSQQRSPSFLRQQRNTFSANTLFIEGSPKTRPPQGIQNALSWNVNARAAQGWVLSVHSEDAGGAAPTQSRETHVAWGRWGGGGGARGPRVLFPGAVPPALHDSTRKRLLQTDKQNNHFPPASHSGWGS